MFVKQKKNCVIGTLLKGEHNAKSASRQFPVGEEGVMSNFICLHKREIKTK